MVGRRARARGAHGRRRWCLTRRRAELSPSSGRKSWFVFSAPFLTLPLLSRNLSQVRLHPDASLGGETPDRFPASLLPRSLGSQIPLFFAWTGSHGLCPLP